MNQQSMLQQYREDGYLVVENLFPEPLVKALQAATTQHINRVASGELSHPLLDTMKDKHGKPALRRIVDPESYDAVYDQAMRYEPLLDIVELLLGGTVRFDHGKLNFKPPTGGAAVEWHQDWAFYPQTNDDMLAVGIMIEDTTVENGPLVVLPGSHRGPVYNHHQQNEFVGAVHADDLQQVIDNAVTLTAPAGSVSIHHVRMLHGSASNHSHANRPLLLFNYLAVDAFPIFHQYEWNSFNQRILRGEATFAPRVEAVPVRVPNPAIASDDAYSSGSLFDLQAGMDGAMYS